MTKARHGIDDLRDSAETRSGASVQHTFDREMVHKVRLDGSVQPNQPNERSKFLERIGTRARKIKTNPFESSV